MRGITDRQRHHVSARDPLDRENEALQRGQLVMATLTTVVSRIDMIAPITTTAAITRTPRSSLSPSARDFIAANALPMSARPRVRGAARATCGAAEVARRRPGGPPPSHRGTGQQRDAADLMAVGDAGRLVDVELDHLQAAGVLAPEAFDERRDRAARSAPGRPEVDEDGHRARWSRHRRSRGRRRRSTAAAVWQALQRGTPDGPGRTRFFVPQLGQAMIVPCSGITFLPVRDALARDGATAHRGFAAQATQRT